MQRHRSTGWQRLGDALAKLRRQVDFGHQDQHLTARRDAFGRGGKIDLGLAAAGDALQQTGRERSGGIDDRRRRALLIGIERHADARSCARRVATRRRRDVVRRDLAAIPPRAAAASARARAPTVPGSTSRRIRARPRRSAGNGGNVAAEAPRSVATCSCGTSDVATTSTTTPASARRASRTSHERAASRRRVRQGSSSRMAPSAATGRATRAMAMTSASRRRDR